MNERECFLAALEIADLKAREEYLDRVCQNQSELRNRIKQLFDSHDLAGDFLNTPIVRPQVVPAPAEFSASAADQVQETDPNDRASANSANAGSVAAAAPKPPGADTQVDDSNCDHFVAIPGLLPSRRADSLGRLTHYEILEVLGKGAYGTVFKAFDDKLHRQVAIKMLSSEIAATSPARQRFLREARSAAAIRHENVVAIYAVEEHPTPFLVMEYIRGKTLQERVDERGPLQTAEVLQIGEQIALGLAAAHACGLVHRDIKSANILVEDGVHPVVKITDFGLARAVDDASITQSAVIAGTPMYMSPEQARGQTIDQRSDLFSLGSVLYQLISGRPPFRAATSFAILQRVADDTPRPLHEIIPGIPEPLIQMISKLHAKLPADRYQTATEIAALLGQWRTEFDLTGKLNSLPQPAKWSKFFLSPMGACAAIVGLITALGLFWWRGLPPADNAFQRSMQVATEKEESSYISPQINSSESQPQHDYARKSNVPLEFTNSIGMSFQLIPPGEFAMGTDDSSVRQLVKQALDQKFPSWYIANLESESPRHTVRFSKAIYVSKYEVTTDQFRAFVTETNYVTECMRSGKGGNYDGVKTHTPPLSWESPFPDSVAKNDEPVRQVTWNDACQFCDWLSGKEGKSYRLLTEAEWEYACRAGTSTLYYTGNHLSKSQARIAALSPVQVGSFDPNPWGLYDMLGNVNEWCYDQLDTNYGELPEIDPVDKRDGDIRVIRGGAFYEVSPRSAFRRGMSKSFCADTLGFRVALSVNSTL
jgi:serine/threonine protein kinase